MMLITAFLMAASALAMRNPVVKNVSNSTYSAGQEVTIEWSNASTGFINIDLVNQFAEVLGAPIPVALGVPAAQGKYVWKVPESLRTAVGYKLRVWGQSPPKPEDSLGQSPMFTVFNNVPQAINQFKVLSPSAKEVCAVGKPCKISWDYPDTINGPAYVHIRLFKAGNPNPLYEIDNVPAAQKSYTWDVPNDGKLLNEGLYVSVSGAGTPPQGPGFANDMGANGLPFAIAKELPAAPQLGAQGSNQEQSFEEQAITDTLTSTVTVTTGTTTVLSTVTESNAAVARLPSTGSLASYAVLMVVPALVMLF